MSAPSLPSLLVTQWTASASVLATSAGVAIAYVLAARRASWPARRMAWFMAGIGAIIVALQSGIDGYDVQLLSDHMIQHLMLLVVAPPLLLGGRPVMLALRTLTPAPRRRLAHALDRARPITGPFQSLALFTAVILFTHLPWFYDATLRHSALHGAEHGLYLFAGLLMWSPLLDGDPIPRHRLSGIGKLVYLIVAMMPMALIGAYLNRHATLVYPPYGPPAHALGVSALDDQAQAGALMWVAGGVIMTAVGLWAAVAAMVAEERRQVARDARADRAEASLANAERARPA